MDFWIVLIQTVIKMIFIGAVAFGGVLCGKELKKRKTAKEVTKVEN